LIGRFVEIVQELALMANFQETWNRVQNLLCSIRLLWIGGKQSIKGRAVWLNFIESVRLSLFYIPRASSNAVSKFHKSLLFEVSISNVSHHFAARVLG